LSWLPDQQQGRHLSWQSPTGSGDKSMEQNKAKEYLGIDADHSMRNLAKLTYLNYRPTVSADKEKMLQEEKTDKNKPRKKHVAKR
jgi:hypothetical protein